IAAILIFNICRLFGFSLGWSTTQSMFLAGMLMVSSSAIISKVLDEQNAAHHRSGQLALGVTVLEDIVAVLMLTLLASAVQVGRAETESLWMTIGSLSAFIVFLIFLSLLLVPRLLKKLTVQGTAELRGVVVTGLVLIAAYMAVRAGYSLALGAFILGVIIAGTRHKDEVERSFDGLRNIFGAVFFVSIGMLFDVKLLLQSWGLILLVSALVLLARPLACAIGLLAVGNSSRNALLAGMMLTPIGEFSFVIAQLGIATNAIPETFYALAVGVSLVTSIAGPLLSRHSPAIVDAIEAREPRWLRNWITFYHHWLSEMQGRRSANIVWRLTSKRILQTILQVLFASAIILAANPLYDFTTRFLGEDWLFPQGAKIFFWTAFGVLLLGPIITIWRNIEALVMIFSEALT
ncbi:MAG: cation:proton antiporter, partial [Limisphaerales bacterium]